MLLDPVRLGLHAITSTISLPNLENMAPALKNEFSPILALVCPNKIVQFTP